MLLLTGWCNLQTMTINTNPKVSITKFSSILPGDVFRPEENGDCYFKNDYYLKIESERVLGPNAVNLNTNVLWRFDDGVEVYKAKSANLSIVF